jgi:CheY-like chemotaxis protein
MKARMPTVMVVDDDVDVCGMLETFLGLEGFDVLTALNDRLPSVILLDLMMPVMDGVEFRRHQQREPSFRDIPVVCVSARHDARQTAARLGFAGFLSKPFSLDALMVMVRAFCPAAP